ncbi:MAG: serine hydrolase [Salinivirgaceae bacterium]|nr:serine hydrolase [Salinivirgaceae bacterium]
MSLVYKTLFIFLIFILSSSVLNSEVNRNHLNNDISTPILTVDTTWVDSLMNDMTLEQKIAQLFMISVYSNKSLAYNKEMIQYVKKNQIGGIIFMQGGPVNQAILTNELQRVSQVPLMIGIDGEWGLAMRLDSTISYPKAMAMGAITDDQIIYDFGNQLAEQLKTIGIQINFAPVIDVNNNPNNPVINVRSFGEDKRIVSRKGLAYAMGMQDNNIMAVVKHFPGHGDTDSDSHFDLPLVNHSKTRLNKLELVPFKNLIQNGVGGVMVAHLAVPSLEKEIKRPASLSKIVIDSVLRNELGFKGLVFTDALNMKGVTKYFSPGEIEVEALLAGNDVLLFPEDVSKGIKAVKKAVRKGVLSEQLINERCRRVLLAKKWFGLDQYESIAVNAIKESLNKPEYRKNKAQLIEKSITLIKNENSMVPFKNLDTKKILAIAIGSGNSYAFNKMINRYMSIDTITINNDNILRVDSILKNYKHVIISHTGISNSAKYNFGIKQYELDLIEKISSSINTSVCFFGNPYGLARYYSLEKINSIIVAYSDDVLVQEKMAQALFGGLSVTGVLPVSIDDDFPVGTGIAIEKQIRLAYSQPYEFDLHDSIFHKVDSIVLDAINMGASPGCQVLYAKNGKVIYNKNFGYHTYDKKTEVKEYDLYDIASLTKLAATTISLMKLYEDHKIDPMAKIAKYLPEFSVKDKKSIRVNQILAHQSGMKSWIPFYRNTLTEDGDLRNDLYKKEYSDTFNIKIADRLFLRSDYIDSVYQAIIDTPSYKKKKYRYSDLGFYCLPKIIKNKSGASIDEYAHNEFYSKLGMTRTLYNPLNKFEKAGIVPSEDDQIFRKQIIQGYVHDPGAAMLGGVSGHAGLFSTANDLAKLGQLLLNEGAYGAEFFFKPKTLKVFNKAYYKRKDNRRAMGFDKPALKQGDPGPTCESASQESFGHSGFTGAYFWVDPSNQSIYIFLSNRTFPNQENNKLVKHDIRTKIQQVFYNVFEQ